MNCPSSLSTRPSRDTLTSMSKLYIVRHGRTTWNDEGRVQGHVETPLSQAGLDDLRRLHARLGNIPFVAAYSSDLRRAVETARAILPGSVPLYADPALREVAYGDWEGKKVHEIQEGYPSLQARMMSAGLFFAFPGGESTADLVRRVAPLARAIADAHRDTDDNVLIVAHAGSLRALTLAVLDMPADYFWRFRLSPASVTLITLYSQGGVLDVWNDTSHLGPSRAE